METNTPALNQLELKSVASLLAYVAYAQNTSEERVISVFEEAFGVDDVKALSSNQYDEAIRFLVDLRLGENVN